MRKRKQLLALLLVAVLVLSACGQQKSAATSGGSDMQAVSSSKSGGGKTTLSTDQFVKMLEPLGFHEESVDVSEIAIEFGITKSAFQTVAYCENDYWSGAFFISFINEDMAKMVFDAALSACNEDFSDAKIVQTGGTEYDKIVVEDSDFNEILIVSRVKNTIIYADGYTDDGDNMDEVNPVLVKNGY